MRRPERCRTGRGPTLTLAALLGALAFFTSCPGDDGGSGGAAGDLGPPVAVPLRFEAAVPGALEGGWSVALTRAELALGEVTVYGNSLHEAVAAARRSGARGASGAGWTLGGAPAHAHAGHAHGRADAEAAVAGFHVLDLLAEGGASPGDLALPPALWFDGKLKLGRAAADGSFARPGGGAVADGDPIVGHTLLVEGTATAPDGAAHDLRVTVDAEGWVAGLALDFPVHEGEPVALTLVVRLDALLAAVDLAAAVDAASGAIAFGPASDGYTTLKATLLDATTYVQRDLVD